MKTDITKREEKRVEREQVGNEITGENHCARAQWPSYILPSWVAMGSMAN
jgi:hypothetical protein